jgi:uncharacterized protein (DUF362 family)
LSLVSIVKRNDPEAMVREAVELLGGLNMYVKQGLRVFIKPNVCGGVPGKPGSFTNTAVVASMAKLLRSMNVAVSVGDADSCMYTADVMLPETKIGEVAMKHGAEVINLSRGDMVKIDVPDGYALKSLNVNKTVADADAIIAMPVMKAHACAAVTLGMKVLFGMLPERKKSRYHPRLDHVIVDIASALKPRLTIIDGTIGMEGEGPFKGDPVELGVVIAGNNVVSTDACAAAVMGIDPSSIEHLRLASEKQLGTINLGEIQVRGEQIEAVRRTFRQATPEKRDRALSKISAELGYRVLHGYYEEAVKSWKEAGR